MNKESVIILCLSIQVIILSGLLCKAEYRIGWLEGQAAVYQGIAESQPDGPYIKGK